MNATLAIMPVYRRTDITMIRGEGCYLFDDKGKRYLDFSTSIAVNSLGHAHPHLVRALQEQAATLWCCGNAFSNPGLIRLAERLVAATFADMVFFCSSGAEAVECAVKIIRRHHHMNGQPERFRIITFEGGFHGRTMTGISAGGNASAREGYAPLLDGFDRVPFNDIDAVKSAITRETAGILIEPIQGEGGVRVADPAFLRKLRLLCDERGLLLCFDEVQCGSGRTGTFLASEPTGAAPDIATIAKGIGGGFPLAACLATEKAAACMTPGSHGSTYGANPLAMAAGNAVLDVMGKPGFYEHVKKMGAKLKAELEKQVAAFPHLLHEVRGEGLMLGLRTHVPAADFAAALRERGLLTAPAVGDSVIRILPPLVVEAHHIDKAIIYLRMACEKWGNA